MSLLQVEHLDKSFQRGGMWRKAGGEVQAVQDVSFDIAEGETLAIVGESGSGKSTTARLVMRLIEPDAGRIRLMGTDISALSGKALRAMRRHFQMVFQDPFASLNPRMKILDTVSEGLRVHEPRLSRAGRRERILPLLAQCGLDEDALERYPHQFSGGQRQRIGIARSLAVQPRLLVLDEPVSALDVSVQAQILNLLEELQEEHRLAYLFISHDLSVIRQVADRVAVMFAGRFVETGSVDDVFSHPRHPYTQALLDARPIMHPDERKADGTMAAPELEDVAGTGCVYRLRCPAAEADCEAFDGTLSGGGHCFACLHPIDKRD